MRRLKSPYVYVPLAVLLLAGWFAWQTFGPSPAIIISRETTFITEPLRPDGLPDYEAYLLERMREGVTPENNAAVFLWQAVGPVDYEIDQFEIVCCEIGIKKLPPTEEFLQEVESPEWKNQLKEWLTTIGAIDKPQFDDEFGEEMADQEILGNNRALDLINQLYSRPWTRDQIPPMGDWINQNEKALNLLVKGSKCPRFYSPSPELLNDATDALSGWSLPSIRVPQSIAEGLVVRGMWRLGEGDHEGAWDDILATYRWTLLVGQEPSLFAYLVSFLMKGFANGAMLTLLDSDGISAELLRRIQSDISALPEQNLKLALVFGEFERVDRVSMVVDSPDIADDLVSTVVPIRWLAINWSVVLVELNRFYDQIASAAALPSWTDRKTALDNIVNAVPPNAQSAGANAQISKRIVYLLNRKSRTELVTDAIKSFVTAPIGNAFAAEDMRKSHFALVRLATALAIYRAEQGEYPAQLKKLVPDVLDELPVDIFHDNPFVYRRTDNGYLLYSCGPNGQDDGGSHSDWNIYKGYSTTITPESSLRYLLAGDMPEEIEVEEELDEEDLESTAIERLLSRNIPADADDIAIRMPRPKLVLPAKR